MSFYNHICVTCAIETGKMWIKPGTETSEKPLHQATVMDAQHPAVPIGLRSDEAQLAMLFRAMLIVRETAPQAVAVDLVSSDQDSYGFVLTGVQDAAGNELLPSGWDWDESDPLRNLSDDIQDEISDLQWDGVVGENRGGYATIDLVEFLGRFSHLSAVLPQSADHPQVSS